MKRLLIGLFVVGCGSGAPGEVEMGPVPSMGASGAEWEVAGQPGTPPTRVAGPAYSASAPPADPPELLEAPPPEPAPAAPIAQPACLPGYHEPPSKACCLIDVIPAGSCKCAEYDPPGDTRGRLVVAGDLCFDSCSFGPDGHEVAHAFCVPGGLAADRILK